MSLTSVNNQLLNECDICIERFHRFREEDREPDFFREVQPYAYNIDELLNEWEQLVRPWIQTKRPKYVHPSQIDSLLESMRQFVVQSFYKATSKKRFLKSVHSSKYTLETILQALKEVGE